MKRIKENHALLSAGLLIVAISTAFAASLGINKLRIAQHGKHLTKIVKEKPSVSWAEGVRKVTEDRGKPAGRDAKVEVPGELRHYSDTRRFLAMQVAESREHDVSIPRDFIDLASMLKSGELKSLSPMNPDYILIGVGGNANKEPFARYEERRITPLYSEAELAAEFTRLAETQTKVQSEIADLRSDLGAVSKRDRRERVRLEKRIDEKRAALEKARETEEKLQRLYSAHHRSTMSADYQSLEDLAKSFYERSYDISDERSRRELKVRMLSSLRPEAVKVLEEVAESYTEEFDRPLPITSLIRPEIYQRELSKVNSNATRIALPPHSTGLAFDILYKYMSAEEQAFVMAELARMEDEGRIEVLRENNGCYHVFAFIDGKRPTEASIRNSLDITSKSSD